MDFYSRGFYINNYTYDDIPSTQTGAWNFGETDGDSAIYERTDVVRGSTGLMTGTGNPGAAINMIRKRLTAKHSPVISPPATVVGTISAMLPTCPDR